MVHTEAQERGIWLWHVRHVWGDLNKVLTLKADRYGMPLQETNKKKVIKKK